MIPRLVYDGDCGFCTRSAEWLARHGEFTLVRFSEVTPDLRARLPADYERCAHLVTDDAVYSCGAAMDEAFARTDVAPGGLVRAARRVPGYERARDASYRWIAANRDRVGRLLGP